MTVQIRRYSSGHLVALLPEEGLAFQYEGGKSILADCDIEETRRNTLPVLDHERGWLDLRSMVFAELGA